MGCTEDSYGYLAAIGDEDLSELHDCTVRAHPLVNGMIFARVAFIEDLGILILLFVVGHAVNGSSD